MSILSIFKCPKKLGTQLFLQWKWRLSCSSWLVLLLSYTGQFLPIPENGASCTQSIVWAKGELGPSRTRAQALQDVFTSKEEEVPEVWSPSKCPLCLVKIISQVIKEGPKEWSNYCTIALISHASKVMLKILQARLQQYVNRELPDVQAGFRQGRRTRDQIANIFWIIKKQESSRKTSVSALLTMPKPLTVWITINCGKFFKRWEYQTTWPASWETCMQVRKQQLELDMDQQTGSK